MLVHKASRGQWVCRESLAHLDQMVQLETKGLKVTLGLRGFLVLVVSLD